VGVKLLLYIAKVPVEISTPTAFNLRVWEESDAREIYSIEFL
jgi:hypothetical protein